MSGPAATLLFSTYNGAKTLPRMLDALTQQTLPHEQWQIIAVDNNSKDNTREILDSYLDRLPLEICFEPRQGKQHALTSGLLHAKGEIVILSDDDVIPASDWIEQFIKVGAEQPNYAIFGGLILPEWEAAPAPWILSHAHLGVLYALNGELAEGPISAALISGPNSAFRRTIIEGGYVVHDGLGPDASIGQYPMGEDTAFALRLERRGAKAFHSRRPQLRHIIRANYVEENWILARAERYGMGLVTIRPELFASKAKIAGIPLMPALLWLGTWPVGKMLRLAPHSPHNYRILWNQSVRQGIVRQFASDRRRDHPSGAERLMSTQAVAAVSAAAPAGDIHD